MSMSIGSANDDIHAGDPATAGAVAASDRHLAPDGLSATLTRFEIALTRTHEAFASWALELNKHCTGVQLSFADTALLHCVRLRGGSTTLAEMLIFLHRYDLAAVQYGLRKLEARGFVKRDRIKTRREVAYSITEAGRAATDVYGRLRQQLLVNQCRDVIAIEESIDGATVVLERLIGMYDHAMQAILSNQLFMHAGGRERSWPPAVAAQKAETAAKPAEKGNGTATGGKPRARRPRPRS